MHTILSCLHHHLQIIIVQTVHNLIQSYGGFQSGGSLPSHHRFQYVLSRSSMTTGFDRMIWRIKSPAPLERAEQIAAAHHPPGSERIDTSFQCIAETRIFSEETVGATVCYSATCSFYHVLTSFWFFIGSFYCPNTWWIWWDSDTSESPRILPQW